MYKSAKRKRPSPPQANPTGEPHGNAGPFTPAKLTYASDGGTVKRTQGLEHTAPEEKGTGTKC